MVFCHLIIQRLVSCNDPGIIYHLVIGKPQILLFEIKQNSYGTAKR